jgi:hypothetical protein
MTQILNLSDYHLILSDEHSRFVIRSSSQASPPGGICTHWKAPPFHGARHKLTRAPQQTAPLFDHLVGRREQRRWDGEAENPRRLVVDYQLEL